MVCTRSRFAFLAAACLAVASAVDSAVTYVRQAVASAALEVVKVLAPKPVGFTWVHRLPALVARVLRFSHYQRRQERGELSLPPLGTCPC